MVEGPITRLVRTTFEKEQDRPEIRLVRAAETIDVRIAKGEFKEKTIRLLINRIIKAKLATGLVGSEIKVYQIKKAIEFIANNPTIGKAGSFKKYHHTDAFDTAPEKIESHKERLLEELWANWLEFAKKREEATREIVRQRKKRKISLTSAKRIAKAKEGEAKKVQSAIRRRLK